MKINVLDSSIYNLISAGEVVERPASVVKELVENSIDAGAKNVRIEITAGGKTRIKVTDDGAGIEKDDMSNAFLPHATSKIRDKNDLFSIKTLGFRGEALASVAAVSMVSAFSKTDDDDCAHGIELRGGKAEKTFECPGVTGTSVTVENLFFATPARLKFLKKDKSEESEITALVAKTALSNPFVAFTYVADGKTLLKTYGKGLKDAVSNVYNREIAMNFIEFENTYGDMNIKGFISAPTFFKGNRSYQTTIINGRVIENKTVTAAVEKAFEPFLMKRSYPLFVLDITMPFDSLDVNVHPSKSDVRFADNNKIFSFVYNSVQRVLSSYDDIKSAPQIEYVPDATDFPSETTDEKENASFCENSSFVSRPAGNRGNIFDGIFSANRASEGGDSFYRMIKNRISVTDNVKSMHEYEKRDEGIQQTFLDTNDPSYERSGFSFDFQGKIIGQVFSTYILVEKDDYLYVIDQHAAHERILYDKLIGAEGGYSQPLLIPYIYYANAREKDFIEEIIPSLNGIGFDISEFSDDSFKVSAVPEALTDIDFDEFFACITKDFIRTDIKDKDLLKEKLMQTACKSAIKGGDALNDMQIDALLKSFAASEDKPLQCPHGRPTVIKFSKTDFEKWFKRIV
ncbi:MAG: DNA mismatch repair endonuclease MutL [Eubacteriales bacterium]|nr:DNA mismatch repair endonuclease MutL [Christensenellaceae bacterium]MDY2751016.1 DNA mismatch repair endonuclease MutL [Eubacteriales bacterium]